jgi:hypothetical protein
MPCAMSTSAPNALFVVVDPEAANLVLDLQRKGLHVRKAQKAVKDGITRVTGIIPDLTIDPSLRQYPGRD